MSPSDPPATPDAAAPLSAIPSRDTPDAQATTPSAVVPGAGRPASAANESDVRAGSGGTAGDAARVLASLAPFSELTPVERAKLAASLEEITLDAGDLIFAEGEPADAVYILRSGRAERLAQGVRLATVDAPAVFGTLALLRGERRSATLRALTPCAVWRLPGDRFTRLLGTTPRLSTQFAASVSHRLVAAQDEVAALRRVLLGEMAEQQGPGEIADARRALAARAQRAGASDLAIGTLLEGDLLEEAAAVAEQAVEEAERAGQTDRARRLAGLLPEAILRVRPHLWEAAYGGAPGAPVSPAGRIAVGTTARGWGAGWRRWRPGRAVSGLTLAALALLIGWLVPPPAGLTLDGWRALATLVAVVPLLALDALPEGIVALGLAAAWVIGGVAPPEVALGGYATSTWVLVVTVLIVGGVIASSGLLYRLALWAIGRGRSSFGGQVVALGLVGLAVGPAVPNATARVTLVAPAVSELVEALGYGAGSRAAAGLAMAVHAGFGQMTAAFLTSSTTALVVYAVLPESARAGVDWLTWALRAAPTTALLMAGLLAAVYWLYRPSPAVASSTSASSTTSAGGPGGKDGSGETRTDPSQHEPPLQAGHPAQRGGPAQIAASLAAGTASRGRGSAEKPPGARQAESLALQRELLGPLSRHEKIALAVGVGLVLGFVLQPLHGIHPGWLGVIALAVSAASGVLSNEGLRSVNWSFVLLVGILTSMAEVFEVAGLDRWLADAAALALGGVAAVPVLFVAVLTVLCLGISFVLRWQAAAPLLTIALAPLATSAGIDPWVVGLVAILACNPFFLPYQSTIYLALYHGTGGRLFTHAQARPAALAYGVVTLAALCASVPVWHLMGLV